MSKSIKKLILYLLVVLGMYAVFLFIDEVDLLKGEAPEIFVPNTVQEISIHDGEDTLLKEITAKDKEDGDITDKVFIKDISEFNEKQERTVIYAVFDNNDNIAHGTRKIKYKDYEPPMLDLKKPLCYYYFNEYEELIKYLKANSVIDGNLSDKIEIEKVEKTEDSDDGDEYCTFYVKDSCGGSDRLRLKLTEYNIEPYIRLELSDYLIRVKKGTNINPRSYVSKIAYLGMNHNEWKDKVEISTDYNPNKEGTYEFVYTLEKQNGDYGLTKLVVIVE